MDEANTINITLMLMAGERKWMVTLCTKGDTFHKPAVKVNNKRSWVLLHKQGNKKHVQIVTNAVVT